MLEPNIASRYSTLDMIARTDCNGSAVYDTLPGKVVIVLGIECVFKFISDAITEEGAEGGFKHRFAILWKASPHQRTQLLHSRCAPFQRSALHLLYEGGIPFFFPVISADTNAMASSFLCLMTSLSFLSMSNQLFHTKKSRLFPGSASTILSTKINIYF